MTVSRLIRPFLVLAAVLGLAGGGHYVYAAGQEAGRDAVAQLDNPRVAVADPAPHVPAPVVVPHAEPTVLALADVAAPQLDAGVTAVTDKPLATAPPAPTIPDPVAHPAEAFDQVRAALKVGWPVALLVALDMLLLTIGHLGLTWLKTGHRALYLAAATTAVTAGAVAATSGMAWTAALLAALTAGWGYYRSQAGAAQAVA